MSKTPLGPHGAYLELGEILGAVHLKRVADGVLWTQRVRVVVPPPLEHQARADRPAACYCLRDVLARLEYTGLDQPRLWLAHALPLAPQFVRFDGTYFDLDLQFHLTTHAMARLETAREGRQARFQLGFHAQLHRIGAYVMEHNDNVPRPLVASLLFAVERDAWVRALREARVTHTLVLEVPLPDAAPAAYSDALRAMQQAERALESGGKAGWHGCAASVRIAIEKWPGAGSTDAIKTDRSRDLSGRMAVLRDAVRNVTHVAHHELEDHWTRADALALFAAAASLLARETQGS